MFIQLDIDLENWRGKQFDQGQIAFHVSEWFASLLHFQMCEKSLLCTIQVGRNLTPAETGYHRYFDFLRLPLLKIP